MRDEKQNGAGKNEYLWYKQMALFFLFQIEICVILMLVGYSRMTTGQPGESITMPSLVPKKAKHEILPNKPTIEEKPINNKNPYQDRTPAVGGYTYPVIF